MARHGKYKIIYPAIVFNAILIVLFALNLNWLAIGILIFLIVLAITRSLYKKNIYYFSLLIAMIAGTAIFIRVFIVEIYRVPSASMENTLFVNDRIIVNKLIYGPRLPRLLSDIPWLGVFFSNKNFNQLPDKFNKRLSGYGFIRRNDLIVLRQPNKSKKMLVKRCIGLPGETIIIQEDRVYINGFLLVQPESVKNLYILTPKGNNQMDTVSIRKAGIELLEILPIDNTVRGCVYLNTTKKRNLLSSMRHQISITFLHLSFGANKWNPNLLWKPGNFGPLFIPKKGISIELTAKNLKIFSSIIQNFDDPDGIDLVHSLDKTYTFKKDYVFVLGDNRSLSEDSRYWGLVPEEYIEGKAQKLY